jgi:hypothetical protein
MHQLRGRRAVGSRRSGGAFLSTAEVGRAERDAVIP